MRDYKVNKEAISELFCAEVYEIVRSVPVGRVTTYGEIAALLGKPQCSRMVGKALINKWRAEKDKSLVFALQILKRCLE